MPRKPKATIHFVGTPALRDEIRLVARNQDRSASALIRQAIRYWLDHDCNPPAQRHRREAGTT
jgi:hypothetical protein